MKKIKFAIVAFSVSLSIIIGLSALHIARRNNIFASGDKTEITGSVDDYIKSQEKEKAHKASEALWVIENYDFPFDVENEEFKKGVKNIKKLGFKTLLIDSVAYSEKGEKKPEDEKLIEALKYLKEEKLKVYLKVDSAFGDKTVGDIAEYTSGILLCCGETNAEKLNDYLLKIRTLITLNNPKAKLYASVPLTMDLTAFNKRSANGFYFEAKEKENFELLKKWSYALNLSGTDMILNFDLNAVLKGEAEPKAPLSSVYESEVFSAVSTRSFNSYKAVKANKENSFSAIRKYTDEGLYPAISLREMGITGYSGEVLESSEFTSEIEIYGSDVFPVYINGEKIFLGESGSVRRSFVLEEGMNEFEITSGLKSVTYRVNVTFNGDLLKSVTPEGEISLYPKEKTMVTAIAYYKSDLIVKVGTKTYKAKPVDSSATGYVAFSAKIDMPKTKEEIASLGMITVIASCGGESMQLKGANIVPASEPVITLPEEEKTTTPIKIENYVPSIPGSVIENSPTLGPVVTTPTSPPQNLTPSYGNYTGKEMAMVNVPYADTRPLVFGDDTYSPETSALAYGTMDYITAQSEAYSKELNEQIYFYELSSGVKIKREDAQLISRPNLSDNKLSVLSSSGENGTLKIRLSTLWKVPYKISFTPQSYFSQYGTKFNLTSFNANYIAVTFYHTYAVEGSVNFSLSNVISNATWDISESNKTVTLYMPLRALGDYYGCSLEYDENGFMVLTIHNKPQTLSGSVILLDPGHGGKDPGALGYSGAVEESDINLSIAYYTMTALQQRGATVYSTRSGDEAKELEERKAIARAMKPDLFVSIHSNGSEKKESIGTSTYYYKPFSKELAYNIYSEMLAVFKGVLYSGQAEYYDAISDGAPYYPFSVLRLDECPSVLIETGYVTNDAECYKLIQPSYQQYLGEAIAKGIEKTIG